MGRDEELKLLAFSLYPLSFFLYSPFKRKLLCIVSSMLLVMLWFYRDLYHDQTTHHGVFALFTQCLGDTVHTGTVHYLFIIFPLFRSVPIYAVINKATKRKVEAQVKYYFKIFILKIVFHRFVYYLTVLKRVSHET